MKDNLIDEERAKQEEAAQESLEQKIDRLGKFISLTWVLSLNSAHPRAPHSALSGL